MDRNPMRMKMKKIKIRWKLHERRIKEVDVAEHVEAL